MLTHLSVRNFAVVKSLDIDFKQGMTAITGETGAGKSIAIDALGLCLGDRATTNVVRPNSDKADLTAMFDISKNKSAKKSTDIFMKDLDRQMYKLAELKSAIESGLKLNLPLTDESSAIEAAGLPSIMIEGKSDNIKITRPDDLTFAQFILNNQQGLL